MSARNKEDNKQCAFSRRTFFLRPYDFKSAELAFPCRVPLPLADMSAVPHDLAALLFRLLKDSLQPELHHTQEHNSGIAKNKHNMRPTVPFVLHEITSIALHKRGIIPMQCRSTSAVLQAILRWEKKHERQLQMQLKQRTSTLHFLHRDKTLPKNWDQEEAPPRQLRCFVDTKTTENAAQTHHCL